MEAFVTVLPNKFYKYPCVVIQDRHMVVSCSIRILRFNITILTFPAVALGCSRWPEVYLYIYQRYTSLTVRGVGVYSGSCGMDSLKVRTHANLTRTIIIVRPYNSVDHKKRIIREQNGNSFRGQNGKCVALCANYGGYLQATDSGIARPYRRTHFHHDAQTREAVRISFSLAFYSSAVAKAIH